MLHHFHDAIIDLQHIPACEGVPTVRSKERPNPKSKYEKKERKEEKGPQREQQAETVRFGGVNRRRRHEPLIEPRGSTKFRRETFPSGIHKDPTPVVRRVGQTLAGGQLCCGLLEGCGFREYVGGHRNRLFHSHRPNDRVGRGFGGGENVRLGCVDAKGSILFDQLVAFVEIRA